MTPRRQMQVLWAVFSLGAVVGTVEWAHTRHVIVATAQGDMAATRPAPEWRVATEESVDAAAGNIGDHDMFRLTREPARVPYDANREGAPPPPPAPPRPPVSLSGIVGPPWVAVLEGVPGHEGSLVARVGDTVSRAPNALLVVRRVGRDTAIVSSTDTTWALGIHRSQP
jgi:hypothetical protein